MSAYLLVFTKTCLCPPRYYISEVWSGVMNVFILLHSINLAVILLAAWIYLHPFDAARPSMQWIYVAHAIAFISLVLVVVQVFLCPRNKRRTGYLAFWGIRSQGWSVFVLMAAGFMYWVFDGAAYQVLAYSLAVTGMVMFAGGPMLVYSSFPVLLPARCRRVSAEDVGDEPGS